MYEIRNAPFFILSLIIEIKPVEFKKHISFLEGMGGGGELRLVLTLTSPYLLGLYQNRDAFRLPTFCNVR